MKLFNRRVRTQSSAANTHREPAHLLDRWLSARARRYRDDCSAFMIFPVADCCAHDAESTDADAASRESGCGFEGGNATQRAAYAETTLIWPPLAPRFIDLMNMQYYRNTNASSLQEGFSWAQLPCCSFRPPTRGGRSSPFR